MKIVYFGTPYFAVQVLKYLEEKSLQICAIVTRPDRAKGRSLQVSPSPVKLWAQKNAPTIPILEPEKASNPAFIQELRLLKADLFIVVGYGQILREELIKIPKHCINVHASLLPKYRGADPMRRVLLDGEKKTGITIMQVVKELDAGDMYAKKEVTIDSNWTYGDLQDKLIEIAGSLLFEVIQKAQKHPLQGEKQDHHLSTYASKIAPQEKEISWHFPAEEIHNQIRAFSPKPGAWCWVYLEGEKKKCKILRSKVSLQEGSPGQIVEKSKKSLVVACQKNALEILEVQLEGKKRLSIDAFLAGLSKKILF